MLKRFQRSDVHHLDLRFKRWDLRVSVFTCSGMSSAARRTKLDKWLIEVILSFQIFQDLSGSFSIYQDLYFRIQVLCILWHNTIWHHSSDGIRRHTENPKDLTDASPEMSFMQLCALHSPLGCAGMVVSNVDFNMLKNMLKERFRNCLKLLG
jgi:post-segregation antitoxin (ccd killing protein)